MGLAGKLGTTAPSAPPMPGPSGAGGYSAYGAPPQANNAYPSIGQTSTSGAVGYSAYGAPPQANNAYPSIGQTSTPIGQSGISGQQQPGQYGQPLSQTSQRPGQYGQQPGQYNQQPGQFGQQSGQQLGQFGQQPGQLDQQPGQFGQQPGLGGQQAGQYGQAGGQLGQGGAQFGQQQGQSGQSQGQFGQRPGQPGQFGQQPGQFGQQPGQFGQQPGQFGQQLGQQPGQFGQQQGQFGQQPRPQGPSGGAFDHNTIRQKLQQLISENRLQNFYPPQRIEQLVQFVSSRDVAGLGDRWRLPREVTLDLVGLALYDIVLYIDDSGSMAFEEGGERIDDMKAVLGRTADAATLFDTDGIVVRFMNGTTEGNGIRSEAEAAALVQNVKFSGTTPLGSNLDRKVLQPMVLSQARNNSMQKPVLVICITDGEPTGEPKDTVRQVVMNAKQHLQNTPYGSGAVAFQFAQVGKDPAATRFLSALDVDPVIGGMIDCTSYYEQEQEEYARKGINLDPSLYLVKLMVGGIDRSYDEGDEG